MTPLFSIIIPARNEERCIALCLKSIAEAARPFSEGAIEIIVVLNRCIDNTEVLAKSCGAKTVVENAKNLACIRNAGAKIATGKILVTIDADSRMAPNMLQVIEQRMNSGRYIGGGVAMFPERYSLGILVTFFMLLPIAVWNGILGGLFFCLRNDFLEIGGFDEKFATVEDVDFAKRLKAFGKRQNPPKRFALVLNSHIVTSCRKFDYFGDWYMVLHPIEFIKLLKGADQERANKYWYDFSGR